MASEKITAIIESVKALTVLELSELVHAIEDEFGVSAAAPVAVMGAAAAAPAPQVEEGIPGDVVAAIMAAIHAMGNGKYTLKAVRRSKNGWGNASRSCCGAQP